MPLRQVFCQESLLIRALCTGDHPQFSRSYSLSVPDAPTITPSSSGPGHHRPTDFCLVHPRTTPYYEISTLIPFVTSQIDDCPHKLTRVFPTCFFLTHTLLEKTSQGVTYPIVTPGQARLTLEFLRLSNQKDNASYCICSTYQIF